MGAALYATDEAAGAEEAAGDGVDADDDVVDAEIVDEPAETDEAEDK